MIDTIEFSSRTLQHKRGFEAALERRASIRANGISSPGTLSGRTQDGYVENPKIASLETQLIGSTKAEDGDKDTLPDLEIGNGAHITTALPKIQKAILTPRVGPCLDLRYQEISVTIPRHDEVIVRIAWTGICGSDASFSTGPKPGFPTHNHISGHEGIGHIVASHDPSILNQPVAMRFLGYTCQSCKYCLRGCLESCAEQIAFSKDCNGSFQQFATVPRKAVIPLPSFVFDGTSDVKPSSYSAALCSGSAALKAIRAADVRPHDVLVVFGVGGAIGHLIGLLARHVFHLKVIGVDVASKLDNSLLNPNHAHAVCDQFLAAPCTAAEKVQFKKHLFCACNELRGLLGGFQHAADAVISCSNRIAGFEDLTSYVCDGGSIIIVGGPSDGKQLSFPLFEVLERQIKIRGSLMGGPKEMYECLEYIRAGQLRPHIVEIDLSDIPYHMSNILKLKTIGKVVVRINGLLESPLSIVK